MSDPVSSRPPWWFRQHIGSYTLSAEEAWSMIQGPPWKCVVAWVTKDVQPVACEMAYVLLDGRIVLTSTSNRDKVRALRRNPAVSLCFSGRGLKQVTVRGRVEISDDPARVRRWAEAAADQLSLCGTAREQEIERYLSPDRVTLTVAIDKIRSFDGARMFREERGLESGSGSEEQSSAKA